MAKEFPSIMTLLYDSYETIYQPKVIRSQFESGIIKQRRVQCRTYKVHSAVYAICGQDELKEFYSWLNNDIAGGAAWFLWPDPTNEGTLTRARLRGENVAVTPQSKNFDSWEIKLSIEVWSE